MSRTGSRSARVVQVMTPPGEVELLIDPTDPAQRTTACRPHRQRSDDRQLLPALRPGTALMSATTSSDNDRNPPPRFPRDEQACADRRQRQGPPAAIAVRLRPSLDRDASPRRARNGNDERQKQGRQPLTRPHLQA